MIFPLESAQIPNLVLFSQMRPLNHDTFFNPPFCLGETILPERMYLFSLRNLSFAKQIVSLMRSNCFLLQLIQMYCSVEVRGNERVVVY